MKKVTEENGMLKGYVEFVAKQFHRVIDHEQEAHDKQVSGSRACRSGRPVSHPMAIPGTLRPSDPRAVNAPEGLRSAGCALHE